MSELRPGDEVHVTTPPASEYYERVLRLSRHGHIDALLKGPGAVVLARVTIHNGTKRYAGHLFPVYEPRADEELT